MSLQPAVPRCWRLRQISSSATACSPCRSRCFRPRLPRLSPQAQYGRTWGPTSFALILVCMVAARTAAMGANRLLDARLDALNPRTRSRAIPSGRLTTAVRRYDDPRLERRVSARVRGFGVIYGNWLPTALGLPVLAFLCGYPLLKRFSSLCHYYLGAALALSPVCAWIAVSGTIAAEPFVMAAAVLCWTAGFDVIYATADAESDAATGVHSVPASLGIGPALWVSRATHVLAATLLVVLGVVSPNLSMPWFVACGLVAALLVVEHLLVRPDDLSKVGMAFFTVNGIISLLLGTTGIIDAMT